MGWYGSRPSQECRASSRSFDRRYCEGEIFKARVVIEATGTIRYLWSGNIGGCCFSTLPMDRRSFSSPPVEPQQFVAQDFGAIIYRQRSGRANRPPSSMRGFWRRGIFCRRNILGTVSARKFWTIGRRLHQRLAAGGLRWQKFMKSNAVFFRWRLHCPNLHQPVVDSAGLQAWYTLHQVTWWEHYCARAPGLAQAISTAMQDPQAEPAAIARAAWQELWNPDRLRKYYLYRFGLEKLMRFDEVLIKQHFDTFFSLPQSQWAGFLADGISTPELLVAMVRLFAIAPKILYLGLDAIPGGSQSIVAVFKPSKQPALQHRSRSHTNSVGEIGFCAGC